MTLKQRREELEIKILESKVLVERNKAAITGYVRRFMPIAFRAILFALDRDFGNGNPAQPKALPASSGAKEPLPYPINMEKFEKAPCYICGYNGPGYFQVEKHQCAEFYQANKAAME